MRACTVFFVLLAVVAVAAVYTCYGAFDLYVSVDGIPGEATDSLHLNWIDAYALSHTITSFSPSNALHGAYSITKYVDKATPLLYLRSCDGAQISTVTIDLVGTFGSVLTVTLSDVVVSQISTDGVSTNAADVPTEIVEFTYEQIEWAYREYDSGGSPGPLHTECWNVTANGPCP